MSTIVATAQRCAQYGDASRRLSELLGEWARTDTHPAAAAMFAAHCHHLTWHVSLFADRMPSVPATTPPAEPDAALDAALTAAATASTTAARLTAVYEVAFGLLIDAYEHHLAEIDPRVDGPTARVLTLALRDLHADRQEAMALG